LCTPPRKFRTRLPGGKRRHKGEGHTRGVPAQCTSEAPAGVKTFPCVRVFSGCVVNCRSDAKP
jgi:hypothetical protein